jgi:cell division transport system permease protein
MHAAFASPVGASMVCLLLALVLVLPLSLLVAVANLERLAGDWGSERRMTLFLQPGLESGAVEALRTQLDSRPTVREVRHYSPDAVSQDFDRMTGMGEIVALLPDNPFPHVLVVGLDAEGVNAAALAAMQAEMAAQPMVDRIELDLKWVTRLEAIASAAGRFAWVLGLVLTPGALVALVVTIGMHVQNRREEIQLQWLVGGSEAWIRRPFLYIGMWYGLLGGAMALLMLWIMRFWVGSAVTHVGYLYQADFSIQGAGWPLVLPVLTCGALLGWLAAWVASARFIHQVREWPH